jgi:hypothetical protein
MKSSFCILLFVNLFYLGYTQDEKQNSGIQRIATFDDSESSNALPGNPESQDERAGYSIAFDNEGALYFIYPQKKYCVRIQILKY